MREIEITYTNVKIDDVIVELAKYIEQGFRIRCWTSSCGCRYEEEKHTIELVKY